MRYKIQSPQGEFTFIKDELLVWYREKFPWAGEVDNFQLTSLKVGDIKYLGYGVTVTGVAGEAGETHTSCLHNNVYKNVISASLSFYVCKDCKGEVSEVEARRRLV